MNYHLKNLYNKIYEEYIEAYQNMLDLSDYVPEKTIRMIDKNLHNAMKKSYRQAWWDDFFYQRKLRQRARAIERAKKKLEKKHD